MIIYGLITACVLLCVGLCWLVLRGVSHMVDPPERDGPQVTDWWRAQLKHPAHYLGRHHARAKSS